jgi:hypothetical protein
VAGKTCSEPAIIAVLWQGIEARRRALGNMQCGIAIAGSDSRTVTTKETAMFQNKIGKLQSSILGIAIAMVASVAPRTAAADVCHDVDIKVDNAKTTKILAQKLLYKFVEDGEERTLLFPDVEVGAGQFKTVASDQDLRGGEGNKMEYIQLIFKVWCGAGAGGTWLGPYTSVRDTEFLNPYCDSYSDKVYVMHLPGTDLCNP